MGATWVSLLKKIQTKNMLQTPTGRFIYKSLKGVFLKRSAFTTVVTGFGRVGPTASDFKLHQQLPSSVRAPGRMRNVTAPAPSELK